MPPIWIRDNDFEKLMRLRALLQKQSPKKNVSMSQVMSSVLKCLDINGKNDEEIARKIGMNNQSAGVRTRLK